MTRGSILRWLKIFILPLRKPASSSLSLMSASLRTGTRSSRSSLITKTLKRSERLWLRLQTTLWTIPLFWLVMKMLLQKCSRTVHLPSPSTSSRLNLSLCPSPRSRRPSRRLRPTPPKLKSPLLSPRRRNLLLNLRSRRNLSPRPSKRKLKFPRQSQPSLPRPRTLPRRLTLPRRTRRVTPPPSWLQKTSTVSEKLTSTASSLSSTATRRSPSR